MIPAATEGVEWATIGPIAIVVGVVVVGVAMLLSLFRRRGERPAGPELQVFGPEEAEAVAAAQPARPVIDAARAADLGTDVPPVERVAPLPPIEPPAPAAPAPPPPPAEPPSAAPEKPAVPDRALSALDEDIDELAARLRRLGGGRRDES